MQEAQLLVCATLKDLAWLNVCLQSVQKYWSSPHYPIVVVTPDCRRELPRIVAALRAYVVFSSEELHSYVRMTADCYLTSHMVMFMDSHDMFTHSCSTKDFTFSGKPVVLMQQYGLLLDQPEEQANAIYNRRNIIEDLIGIEPQYEYATPVPKVFHRYSIRRLREAIETKNKRPLRDIMVNYYPEYFCEYNFLGSYCYHKEKDQYDWVDASQEQRRFDPMLKRFFGITDPTRGEDHTEVQRILNE